MTWVPVLYLLVQAGLSSPGSSSDACSTLEGLIQIVDLSVAAKSTESDTVFIESINKMSALSEGMSLFSLAPLDGEETFAKERQEILFYIAAVRETSRETDAGRITYARRVLNSAKRSSVAGSISTLNNFWGCHNDSGDVQTEDNKTAPILYDGGVPMGDRRDAAAANGSPYGVDYESPDSLEPEESGTGGRKRNNKSEQHEKQQISIIFGLIILAAITFFSVRSNLKKIRTVRQPCHYNAMLRVDEIEIPVTLLDIAPGGTKIDHHHQLFKKQKLELKLDDKWQRAKIRWLNEEYAGLMFSRNLKDKCIRSILSQQQTATSRSS